MNKLNKTPIIIFVTFLVTTALYVGAYMFVPVFSNTLSNAATFLASSKDGTLNQKLNEIDKIVDEYFIDDVDKEKLKTQAVKAYVAAIEDEYTEYYTPEQYLELTSDISGNYKGIGVEVTVTEDNLITIIDAYDKSPAGKAGIKPKDKIIKVNGTDVNGDNYDLAIDMMRGVGKFGENDEMLLTIKRGDTTFETKAKREHVVSQTVKSILLENDIGYIRLSQFAESSAKDFEKALNSLKTEGAKSLIIDLRNICKINQLISDIYMCVCVCTYLYITPKYNFSSRLPQKYNLCLLQKNR